MTPNQRLAQLLLGTPLDQWLSTKRTSGTPWRAIARDLYTATNGQIDMSHETIRIWCASLLPDEAAS
ncbi:MAG: hypothetical protein U0990_11485 [Candidatus Nanopelagicales bacterium]|nr:hypothetical protein [Candidatus Nanopelagicales bacterium]MDZ4250689.1 hypothetical protein [Candidatus Nanopelagicales bacterium]